MTREEQIHNQATNYGYAVAGGSTMRPPVSKAFLEGAKWADANQPNPWISVEERLPERRSNNNPYSERVYVRYVQTVSGNKRIFYAFDELQYICLSSGKIIGHEWCRHQNEYDSVTHWMPIPELPKEEGK